MILLWMNKVYRFVFSYLIYTACHLICKTAVNAVTPVGTVLVRSQNTSPVNTVVCVSCFSAENKPFSRDEWDLPQRFTCKKHEPHAEAFSQRLQHFPQNVVPSCRVSLHFWCDLFFYVLLPQRLNVLPPRLVVLCSYSDFQAYTRAKKSKTYICKPDTGCQGKGIFITKSSKDIQAGEHMICQVYISRVRVCQTTLQQLHRHAHRLKRLLFPSSAAHHRRVQVWPAYLRAGDVMWSFQHIHVQGGAGSLLHHEVQRTDTQQRGKKH